MDLLYRLGGLKGQEIGNMFDIDYSTVSVSRKRLRNKLQKDHDLKRLLFRIEAKLSKLNRLSGNRYFGQFASHLDFYV